MEQPPRARGRARGRHPAAEVPNPGQLHREQGRPAPGLRAAGEVPQQYGNQGLHHQLPEGAVGGRATHPLRPDHQGGGDEALSGRMMHMNIRAPSGPGGDAPSRGGIRQGRFLPEFVRTRPEQCGSKKGESGQPEILTANYFQLVKTTDWCLYQYRVDFAPEVDDKRQKKLLLRIHKAEIGGYLFDGTVLFASRRLHPDPMELFSDGPGGQPVKITIRLVGDVDFGDPQYLQVLNILMRRCLGHLRLQLVGRNFFDPHASETVREYNLEVWPGYVTSIRQHETAILMCAEITHKVMRQDTVLNNLNGYVQQNPKDYQLEFKRDILGAVVLTDYNNKTYRVDDVDFNSSPLARFPMKDGQEVSYIDYYRTRYGIEIRNPDQPMLVSRPSARDRRAGQTTLIYLVPELCRMTGLSESMRSNFHLMRGLSAHTRVDPVTRIEKLLQFNQRLSATPEVRQDMTEWNMQLSKDLVHFPGRILQQESILQGEKLKYPAGPDADWTRELRKNPMLAIGVLKEWVVIFPDRFTRETQSFVNNLIKAAAGMSFVMAQPHYHNIPDDRRHTYTNNLENVISAKNPRMILCVVSNNGSDRYSDIKRTCCLKHAVPTQVIVARNLSAKGVLSIATKVAIQMNCKIGGAPWSVEIPLSGLMVVGFDVCHDTSSVRKSSWGAMVASLDKGCSRYFSSVSQHVNHEEICNELSVNLTKALHKYKQYNQGTLPQRIIIYRDGVGEGQLPYVFDHEVEVVRRNLSSLYGGNPVKMAFIVVSKRINTRLFLKGRNPPPGTVADDCITLPERYDFFLVSQSVRQGTVSPTYYNVLYDNLGLSPDKIQRLTYKMTHLYFNWSGTVRVPAPCQYAHKLAFLVGQSLHHPPRNDLEDLLYFL